MQAIVNFHLEKANLSHSGEPSFSQCPKFRFSFDSSARIFDSY